MNKDELKQKADLFASIMPWDEQEDTWEDIAERAYIAGATEATKELKAQIKKMQNCRNCKNEKIEGACGHFTQVGWCRDWELAD